MATFKFIIISLQFAFREGDVIEDLHLTAPGSEEATGRVVGTRKRGKFPLFAVTPIVVAPVFSPTLKFFPFFLFSSEPRFFGCFFFFHNTAI